VPKEFMVALTFLLTFYEDSPRNNTKEMATVKIDGSTKDEEHQ